MPRPRVSSSLQEQIHERSQFRKQLYFNVQSWISLDGLWILKEMGATLWISFKGLEGIKADLRYVNEGRKDWDYKDLLIDPKERIEINPAE